MPLHRSRSDSIIAGVCAGIAEWFGWTPTTVRILYVLVSVLSAAFPGILVYGSAGASEWVGVVSAMTSSAS